MKKVISFFLTAVLVSSICLIPSFAVAPKAGEEKIISTTVETLEDGCTLTTVLSEIETMARQGGTKSGCKTATLRDKNGKAIWDVRLYGDFTYTGTSATCTHSSMDYTIYIGKWKATNMSPTRRGNQAKGAYTMKRYHLGICTQTESDTIILTCNTNGNLL